MLDTDPHWDDRLIDADSALLYPSQIYHCSHLFSYLFLPPFTFELLWKPAYCLSGDQDVFVSIFGFLLRLRKLLPSASRDECRTKVNRNQWNRNWFLVICFTFPCLLGSFFTLLPWFSSLTQKRYRTFSISHLFFDLNQTVTKISHFIINERDNLFACFIYKPIFPVFFYPT